VTSAAASRVARLEGSLHPREAVLAWLAEAQQFPTIEAQARSIAEQPVEAAPLSVIGARVTSAVHEAMKGRPRDEVERAVRRAVGDAVFLLCLVVVLNVEAYDVSKVEGLRGAGTFWWMGALLGGPDEPPLSEEDARERRDAWRLWRSVVERLSLDVRVEDEARTSLKARYLGGHEALFPDAAAAWSRHVELVERLGSLAETFGSAEEAPSSRPSARPGSDGGSFEDRVEALAGRLADDGRVRAYAILGDRERAVRIMEQRLRGGDASTHTTR
jgi:hypothetical protein